MGRGFVAVIIDDGLNVWKFRGECGQFGFAAFIHPFPRLLCAGHLVGTDMRSGRHLLDIKPVSPHTLLAAKQRIFSSECLFPIV